MVASSATARTLRQVASRCSGEPQSAILGVLHPPILRILADGRPATVDELAAVTSRPAEQIAEMLRRIDPIELGADGSVLGLGLTLVPTAHRVELPGRRRLVYAWCAPDAVILPSAIGESARVTSPCHATNRHVTVELSSDALVSVDPPTAVVSFVVSPDRADLRGTGCEHQNLFASAEAAAGWLAARPDSEVIPVAQAFGLLVEAIHACGLDIGSVSEHD